MDSGLRRNDKMKYRGEFWIPAFAGMTERGGITGRDALRGLVG